MIRERGCEIGVIAPDDELRLAVQEIAAAMGLNIMLRMGFLDEAIASARELEQLGAKILVCRGSTSKRLRETNLALPLIDIPITAFDMIALLDQARKLGEPVAVVGVDALLRGTLELAPILRIKAQAFPVESEGGLPLLLSRIRDDGFKVVVGARQVVEYASRLGLPALPLRSHDQVIATALGEAKKLVEFLHKEEEWGMRLQAAFHTIKEGIVSFDHQGRILHCNKVAGRILNISTLNFPLALPPALRDSGIEQVLATGSGWDGEVISINRTNYVCSLHPVGSRKEPRGGVVMLQEVASLQKLEHKVRRSLHRERGLSARHHFSLLSPCGPLLQRTIAMATSFAKVDSTVLIEGETGTGKEVFAQSMHNSSRRESGPFVAVSCSALPDQLLESELFGYHEGAFTGARKGGKAGLFELAHNGTIFLDEIGEIPLQIQTKLLRVLEERTVMRLGDDRLIPVDVRVICATNRRLAERVKAGLFREDLYFRINVLYLNLPPLRERREDIAFGLDFFLAHFSRELGRALPVLSPETRAFLVNHHYPGNMRELRNIIERLVVSWHEDKEVPLSALGELWDNAEKDSARSYAEPRPLLQQEEYRLIRRTLEESGGNRSLAASRLGISTTTLWRKLRIMDQDTQPKPLVP